MGSGSPPKPRRDEGGRGRPVDSGAGPHPSVESSALRSSGSREGAGREIVGLFLNSWGIYGDDVEATPFIEHKGLKARVVEGRSDYCELELFDTQDQQDPPSMLVLELNLSGEAPDLVLLAPVEIPESHLLHDRLHLIADHARDVSRDIGCDFYS